MEICEIDGYNGQAININPLFAFTREGGLQPTGRKLKNRSKLELKGVMLNEV
jgi:hypothetical protein